MVFAHFLDGKMLMDKSANLGRGTQFNIEILNQLRQNAEYNVDELDETDIYSDIESESMNTSDSESEGSIIYEEVEYENICNYDNMTGSQFCSSTNGLILDEAIIDEAQEIISENIYQRSVKDTYQDLLNARWKMNDCIDFLKMFYFDLHQSLMGYMPGTYESNFIFGQLVEIDDIMSELNIEDYY